MNNSKNARKQTARIADGKITVNGKVIDNSKEEFPLLVFRDVTYFPLTWRFAVSEFGWDYRFNQQEGLVIDNDKVKPENPEEKQWDITPYSEGHSGRGNQVQFAFFSLTADLAQMELQYRFNSSKHLPAHYGWQFLIWGI